MKTFFIITLFVLGSCTQVQVFKKITVLHFTDDFRAKKDVGQVKVKSCQYAAGEFETGEPSFEKTYEDLVSAKGGLSYITNLTMKNDKLEVSDLKGNRIAGKNCIILKGRGYR